MEEAKSKQNKSGLKTRDESTPAHKSNSAKRKKSVLGDDMGALQMFKNRLKIHNNLYQSEEDTLQKNDE